MTNILASSRKQTTHSPRRKPLLLLASIYFILQIATAGHVLADEKPDLYTSKDSVIRLSSETFKSVVFEHNKSVTHLVQFYNTFCGHCQMFAPIYKELANRVKNWTSVVQVAGIDCSKDENIPTCSENKIEGYPTIFIFPPNAKFQDPKDPPTSLRSLNIPWTVDDIEEAIVDYVTNLTTRASGYPRVVEALQPVKVTRLTDIQRIYPEDSESDEFLSKDHHSLQDLMFIIESDKSFLGRKLIIEYFRINSKLELRRITLTNKQLLKTLLTDADYSKLEASQPLLVRINHLQAGSKAQVLVRGEEKQTLTTLEEPERTDFIFGRFKMFFEHYYSVELKEMSGDLAQPEARTKKPTNVLDVSAKQNNELEIFYLVHNDPVGSKKIFAMDLLKGISFMITHEIRIKGDLNAREYNTVRNLLTVLKKFLPLESWDSTLSEFIDELRMRLDNNRSTYENNGITGQEIKDLLDFSGADQVRLRYNKENWISCYESDRQHKGYTCSLWLLFHSLTVGEYTRAAPVRSKPTLVLTTMRDYITRFLGCTVCSSNFEKETENLEKNLQARNSSVLWLWNTHNNVNQRLNNERASENRKPLVDVIYPTFKRCPECFKTNPETIGVDGKTLNDIEWNEATVLEHFVNIYRPDKIVSPSAMSALLSSIKGRVNYDLIEADLSREYPAMRRLAKSSTDMNRSVEQWNLQSIFSTSDMSICLFLYLSCIVIVAIVCLSLNPKWKRFKTK